MDKRISYKDWQKGKAIHMRCEVYLPAGVKTQFIRFNWEDVSDEDVIKIKAKQSEIFHEEISRILSLWKQIFENNLSDYGNKKKYLSNELNDLRTILSIDENLNVVNHDNPFLNHKGLIFEQESLNQIRSYFQDVILLEKIKSFDFIHSTNFKYQLLSKMPCEIYAQVSWDFYNWLLKFNFEIDSSQIIDSSANKMIETENKSNKKKISSLLELFDSKQEKVDVIKKALDRLNITKDSSERQITAFVDASKNAKTLPPFKNISLMGAIYGDLGKHLPLNIKSRTDGPEYKNMRKSTDKYYGQI